MKTLTTCARTPKRKKAPDLVVMLAKKRRAVQPAFLFVAQDERLVVELRDAALLVSVSELDAFTIP